MDIELKCFGDLIENALMINYHFDNDFSLHYLFRVNLINWNEFY